MKKVLSRIMAFALAAVLFTAPTITQAATVTTSEATVSASTTSTPTLIVYTDTVKYYDYRPDSYYLSNGASTGLDDVIFGNNGNWVVPAFTRLNFSFDLQTSSSYRITVLKMNGSTFDVVMNDVFTGYGSGFDLPVLATNAEYKILLTGVTNTYVYGYRATIIN